MKKLLLIAMATYAFSNECPDLTKPSNPILQVKEIQLLNQNGETIKDIYYDLLKVANKTEKPEAFVNQDTLIQLGSTYYFGQILKAYFNDVEEYKRLLSKASEKNYCK